MGSNPHENHRQRMKSRFLKDGGSSFSEHELLEMLAYSTIKRKNTNEMAHALLKRFGSFAGVFDAPFEELKKVAGVGDETAFLIKLIGAITRAYYNNSQEVGTVLDTSEKIGNYIKPRFTGLTNEVVYLICLDNRCKVLLCEEIFKGSVNKSPVIIRTIAEIALRVFATSVVVVHNHPKGFALPSADDVTTTLQIYQAMKTLDIQLIDHIIVSGNDFVSLADSGYFLEFK